MHKHRIVFLALFAIATLALPFIKLNLNETILTTLLGVSTFLFGTFAAYTVGDRHSRMEKMRDAATIERAELTNLYYLSQNLKPKNITSKLADNIDAYIQALMDHHVQYYFRSNTEFKKIVANIQSAEPESPKETSSFGSSLWSLASLIKARKQQMALIGDRVSLLEWWVLIALATIIISSVLLLNSGTAVSIAIVTIFIVAIDSLMVLLGKLDNLAWKVEQRVVEPYEKVLDEIGKPRYYTEYMVKAGQANLREVHENDYRIATFPNEYPDLSGKQIELVKK